MECNFKKINGTDLSKIIYSIIIFLTGVYIIPNLYKLATEWDRAPMIVATFLVYVVVFTLVPISFVYLALKKVKLEFKFSFLSVIGIILIVIFSHGLIEYLFQQQFFGEYIYLSKTLYISLCLL